jgi:hypothetical protein
MSNQKTYQLFVKGEYCTEGTVQVLEKALSDQAEFAQNHTGVELTVEDVQIKEVTEVNAFIELNNTPVVEFEIPGYMDEHFFTVTVTTGGGYEEEFTSQDDVKEAVSNLLADGTDIQDIEVARKQRVDVETTETRVEASIEIDTPVQGVDLEMLSKEELKARRKQILAELNEIERLLD